MSWWAIANILGVLLVLDFVGIEVLRDIVHWRRHAKDGLGGSQDVAMWGTLIGYLLIIGIIFCLGMSWWTE